MGMVEDAVLEQTARVVIVEDHAVLADGLAAALRGEGFGVHVVCGPSPDAIIDATQDANAHVVVLDLVLGDGVGLSIPLIEPLRALGVEVLVLTGLTDRAVLGEAIEAGACGVVSKAASFDVVLERVGQALRHECAMPLSQREELLEELRARRQDDRTRLAPFEELTPREQDVLADLMDGCSAEEIAAASYVSTATVRSQIRAVLAKLSVHSQVAAIARAHRAGWRRRR
jgi:two-component system, NarL family, nitrate/nitrite response regulator NarL